MTTFFDRYTYLRTAIPPVFVFWTLIMLVLTLFPGDVLPKTGLFSYDKVGHFGMFGGWTFFLGLYLMAYKKIISINLLLLLATGVFFGILIEFLQFIMPLGRVASLGDVIANSLGALTACICLYPLQSYLKKKS